jgi:PAS domain S-box-containing protein
LLRGRTIEELIDLPLMEDPASFATIDVLNKLFAPATYINSNLSSLAICKAVSLSLELGNCDASCLAYVQLGKIVGARFGDYKAGFRFGQLGYDLVERRGLKRFEASTSFRFSLYILRWMKHVRAGRDLMRRAFEMADQMGDVLLAVGACPNLNSGLLFAGEPLQEMQGEAEHGLAYASKTRFGLVIDMITTQLALVRMLRGLTPRFGCLDDGQFNERRTEEHFSGNPALAMAACWHWIRKLQARYTAGDYATAMDAASKAQPLIWSATAFLEDAEYHFYGALARAAWCDCAPAGERRQHLDAIAAHHSKLQVWAENCPENFENRAALVGAEIARIEGRAVDAMELYEQAIHSARANGFIHNEALANELAFRFYAGRGFEKIARVYLQDARHCYLRWGADGKVRQLEEMYPHLRTDEPAPGPTATIATPVEHLDLATVIKMSEAVSGEIVLEKMLDTLMRTAIAQAGAERGLLILSHAVEPRIEAEATTGVDTVQVRLCDLAVTATMLPDTVLHYVLRTGESVILDDAATEPLFAADPYIRQRQARSILCLPLINQAKLIGVLYLENNLTRRAFAPARIAVLKLLASQAAISLENTRLYRDLEQREAKIRRLVDANIIGIVIFTLDGQIIEANEAFLAMVGYSRDDLLSGRISYTGMTPHEWQAATREAIEQLKASGSCKPYEKAYERKDGSRVPVLVGAAFLEGSENQGVAFVLDLTERKRAEAEGRESEQRFREVQMELAHANRVATMGQLTASIVHEVKQPIAATVTNAQAALRFLDAQTVDLDEVRQIQNDIMTDGNRAGEVISRIHDLYKKAPSRRDRWEINRAISEVIELTRGEAVKNGVTVQTELADHLPDIHGDRVQLQQVILNLIINAIQAMSGPSEGIRELHIAAENCGDEGVRVAVRDSGPGLSEESLQRLFEPFYTTKPDGMGMGLSICRSIIEDHGGRLWATRLHPHGALFQFTIPTR